MIDRDEISRRVREADRWWTRVLRSNVPAPIALRTESLRPPDIMLAGAYLRGRTAEDIRATRWRAVEDLVANPRKQFGLHGPDEDVVLPKGGILTFDLDASFYDRVAAVETGGLFDEQDLPPWDTWIAYDSLVAGESAKLLSWIPNDLIPSAERAITVHMCEAYAWLKA
jgi:hypothetical protein